jgi:hypothetical protein
MAPPAAHVLLADATSHGVAAGWTCTTLQAPTATAAGVFRFTGVAGLPGGATVPSGPGAGPSSLILKVLHPPQLAPSGAADAGPLPDFWSEPSAWRYWRREAFVYGSGLLDGLTGGLVAPRCYGVAERADGTVWLWLEDIADLYRQAGGGWPSSQRHLLAARHLGELNGAYLVRGPLPAVPWLNRDDARLCIERAEPHGLRRIADPATWQHPLIRAAFPSPVAEPLLQLWAERESFLAALKRLPQTLCHFDPLVPFNLFARRRADGTEETVAIDWGAAGVGAVGEDLAHFVETSFAVPPGPREKWAGAHDLRRRALEAYLAGLRAAGWCPPDPGLVRAAYTIAAVVQRTFARVAQALYAAEQPEPDERMIERRANQAYFLLDLAGEARQLLRTV